MRRLAVCLLALFLLLTVACSRETREAIATRVFTSGGTAAAEGFIVARTVAVEAARTGGPIARTVAVEAVTTGGPIARTLAAGGAEVGGTLAAGGVNVLGTRLSVAPQQCPPAYTVDSDLNQVVSVTGQQLDTILTETVPGTPLAGLGDTFVNLGRGYGVNPYFIAADAAWQSAWGTSPAAVQKNNLFNYGASPACPFDCAVPFATQADSVATVVPALKADYLTPGGRFYNGETLRGMSAAYTTDPNWAGGVATIMNMLAAVQCR